MVSLFIVVDPGPSRIGSFGMPIFLIMGCLVRVFLGFMLFSLRLCYLVMFLELLILFLFGFSRGRLFFF